MTQAIFLSYASQDADAALRICEALRAAGLEVWFDQSELRGGDAWDASIRNQIKECALFVPIISATTNSRSEGYFRLEWKLAVDRSHLMADDQAFFLPVVIDNTPEASARVPDKFRERQWSRVVDEASAKLFAHRVQQILMPKPDEAAKPVVTSSAIRHDPAPALPPRGASAKTNRLNRKRILIFLAIAVFIAAAVAIKRFTLIAATTSIDSIAVLPFANQSGSEDAEYLSDGMTDTLIASLAKLPKLNVKARSTVYRYKGKEAELKKIGEELSVQAILVGRFVQRGDDVTLALELVDTRTENAIWSEQYRRKQGDLVTLQGEVARDVARKLGAKLSGTEQTALGRIGTNNPKAYELYLKARYLTDTYTKTGTKQGLDLYQEAIALDPQFALAYVGLADNYQTRADWFISPNAAREQSKTAIAKALALDSTLAEAYLAAAEDAYGLGWDWAAAERNYQKAIDLNPGLPEAHEKYASFLMNMGRTAEGLAVVERALKIDPRSTSAKRTLIWVRVMRGDLDSAIEMLKEILAGKPASGRGYGGLAMFYSLKGSSAEALATIARVIHLSGENPDALTAFAYVYANNGKRAEAAAMLKKLQNLSVTEYVSPYQFARMYAVLGEADKAFVQFDRAYAERSQYLATSLSWDPRIDGVRKDPRFADLVRRVGLPKASVRETK